LASLSQVSHFPPPPLWGKFLLISFAPKIPSPPFFFPLGYLPPGQPDERFSQPSFYFFVFVLFSRLWLGLILFFSQFSFPPTFDSFPEELEGILNPSEGTPRAVDQDFVVFLIFSLFFFPGSFSVRLFPAYYVIDDHILIIIVFSEIFFSLPDPSALFASPFNLHLQVLLFFSFPTIVFLWSESDPSIVTPQILSPSSLQI